ncbi:hypothetical protein H257_17759 [Aphanomyces astaci]|uniref:LNR domain-containing protein n=1 Tax=Aphanomyces astaci TaxID=112090 RepID=W4FFR2_APHAT|nr:hypothetical protein H257_17759 [Aphanomyces astaci]ETV65563.1 hypothetical protein H257_17759 [Aphanomyces astaci]|eukprot:XP_009844952.1 hypothetical protein H257_17759 [Aphanomyces astaci]
MLLPSPPPQQRPSQLNAPPKQAARCLRVLVLTMHIIVAMYLVMWATLLQTALDADLVSVRVYQPLVTSVVYVITATLHLYAVYSVVVSECKQRPLSQKVGPSIDAIAPQSRIAFFDLDNWYDHSIILFNLIEIACASTQATTMFRTIVEPAKVVSYAIVVVLYIVLSPLILFVRNTQAKTSLVNVADSILSFTLSCGHPFAAVVFQLSDYVLVHPALEHDNLWSTQTLVLTRQLLPSTFVHLCSILGLHVGTYLALRRVMNTSHHIHLALTAVTEKKPPVAPVTRTRTARVKQTLHLLVHASRSSLQDQLKLSRKKRLLLRVNLVVNMTLGMASIVVITRSMVRRTHCPEYCRAYSRPLFDLSCHCAYVEVNCVLQGIVDPLPLLDPAIVGTNALYMEISRCDLSSGLPAASLAPFQDLSKLLILYSNMTSWDEPLPPGVNHVIVRRSRLQSVPSALGGPISPSLVSIFIEHCDLHEVSERVMQSWRNVRQLHLVNVSLQDVPAALLELLHLEELNLQSNRIATLPSPWLVDDSAKVTSSALRLVLLGGNRLVQVPWALAKHSAVVDLSGNPIPPSTTSLSDMASLLEARRVILDGTPFCTATPTTYCKPLCAPYCFATMPGDNYCNLECHSPSCKFDVGDCDRFGFSRNQ